MHIILPAIGAGASAGTILLFFSHVMPKFAAGNYIRDVDQPHLFGRALTRREAHLLGALVHLGLSIVFAAIYGWFVSRGVIEGFSFISLIAWGLILSLFTGGVVLPLEGHGIFGMKEDWWFPLDLLVTNVLWSILFWWLMRLWIGWGIQLS